MSLSLTRLINSLSLVRLNRVLILSVRIVTCTIHKSIWAYGTQLWGIASNSNMEILQSFPNKYLRIIVNALHRDLQRVTR